MIGRLSGKLIEVSPPTILLSVQGVGYELFMPADTLFQLPQLGSDLILWTHLSIREDANTLFGFVDRQQRDWFRQLIRINGVGPKVALSILSTYSCAQLSDAVRDKSVKGLTKIPGVGPKMAQRLLVELESLVDKMSPATAAAPTSVHSSIEEVIGALIGLGYKEKSARGALEKVGGAQDSPETLIKAALKELSNL